MSKSLYINDLTLIKKITNDNERALNLLYTKYIDCLDGIIIKMNGRKEDAREMYNQAIFIVYKNAQAGKLNDYEGNSLLPYIRRIGTTCYLKKLRKLNEDRERPKDPTTIKQCIDEEIIEELSADKRKETLLEVLNSSIEELSPACKELINLTYFEGFIDNEIVEIMQYKNRDTVKSTRNRCKRSLEEKFKENLNN